MINLMLCAEYKDTYWHDKQFVIEEKLDGMRAYAVKTPLGVTLYSRDNNILNGFDYITNELKNSQGDAYIIDGEIVPQGYMKMNHMECFEQVSHINSHDNPGYCFVAFDIIRMFQNNLGTYNERRSILKMVIDELVYTVLSDILYRGEDVKYIQKCIDWAAKNKKEGIVIKDSRSIYESKRSQSWQKLKTRSTIDTKILKINQGTGKYIDSCGSISVEAKHPNGTMVVFQCGTGLSDDIRDFFWNTRKKLIGMTVEIYHSGWTRNAVRHPVFKTLK